MIVASVTVLVLAVVSRPGTPGPDEAAPSGPVVVDAAGGTRVAAQEVAAIARQMTDGLDSGDFSTWSASFDLPPEGLAQQRQLFDNLRLLPLSRREVVALEFADRAVDSSGGEVRTTAEVAFVHAFEGADLASVSERYVLDLVKPQPQAPVRVTAVRGADGGATLYPQPWDRGPIHVAEADRAVVIGAAEDADLLDSRVAAISAGAGRALDALAAADPRPLAQRVVVAVPRPGHGIDDVYFGDGSRTIVEATGVAVDQLAAPVRDIEGNPIGDRDAQTLHGAGRIVLDRELVRDGGTGLDVVAAHETAHLVQDAWQPPQSLVQAAADAGEKTFTRDSRLAPHWMIEGFAEYVGRGFLGGAASSPEYRGALAAVRRPGFEGLPSGGAAVFYEGSPEELGERYGLGLSAFMHIEETRDRATALRFGHAVFNAPSTQAVDRAYADVLGTTPADFEASWSAWLRARA